VPDYTGLTWLGNITNTTNYVSVPYYTILGIFDGAFNATYITECRLNSIRLATNITLLGHSVVVNYGIDNIIKYSTQLVKQFYPFSFYCYF